ncbi:hypothetical protein ILUMI_26889 [Ignelater luminosus]|uniref:HAT C-terminal dimerisation domain-containing protein n=1 Tax=Ignelater luminosus TaxID=2038154 RepID=A0A8K0FYH9_IGNLU|nr:hypothetical protein ILUMI_26889 [Ignelater luminosus]
MTLDEIMKDPNTPRDAKTVFTVMLKISESSQLFLNHNFTVTGAWEAILTLKNMLIWRSNDVTFAKLLKEAQDLSKPVKLDEPRETIRKPQNRLEQTATSSDPVQMTAEMKLKKDFFVVDKIIKLESILHADMLDLTKLKDFLGIHYTDFNVERLRAQLMMLPSIFKDDDCRNNVSNIATVISRQPEKVRRLFKEVETLIILLLTVPALEASAERSFSAVRRILSWNCSSMTQKRLGQSYDDASNMSGQAKIKEKCQYATDVLCAAHSLSSSAAECCLEATKFFGLLRNLYVFFTVSTERTKLLQSFLIKPENVTVKNLSHTQWSARDDACASLNKDWNQTIVALEAMPTKNLLLKMKLQGY